MKRLTVGVILMALAALVLGGCGGGAPAAGQPVAATPSASGLDTGYEGALPLRNQLLLGTLRLDESDQPLSVAQAAALLPLWQGLRGAMNSGASAQAEIDALLRQIESNLTAGQLATIRGWKLSQTDLRAWASSQGLAVGAGAGGGAGMPGSGQSLSPEARATRQAERGGAGESSGLSRALIDAVIALLESKK